MLQITASKARAEFSATLNRVRRGERVLLSNHQKAVAAIVSVDDLAVLRAIEDRADLEAVRAALQEPGSASWDAVKAGLGLA